MDRHTRTRSVVSIGANSYFVVPQARHDQRAQLYLDILGDDVETKYALSQRLQHRRLGASTPCAADLSQHPPATDTHSSASSRTPSTRDGSRLSRQLSRLSATKLSQAFFDDAAAAAGSSAAPIFKPSVELSADDFDNDDALLAHKVHWVRQDTKSSLHENGSTDSLDRLIDTLPRTQTDTALLQHSFKVHKKIHDRMHSLRTPASFSIDVDAGIEDDSAAQLKTKSRRWKKLLKLDMVSRRAPKQKQAESPPEAFVIKHHYDPSFVPSREDLQQKDGASEHELDVEFDDHGLSTVSADAEPNPFDHSSAPGSSSSSSSLRQLPQSRSSFSLSKSLHDAEPLQYMYRPLVQHSIPHRKSDPILSKRFSSVSPPNVATRTPISPALRQSLYKRSTMLHVPSTINSARHSHLFRSSVPIKLQQKIVTLHRLCVADDRLANGPSTLAIDNGELLSNFSSLRDETLEKAPAFDYSSKFGDFYPPRKQRPFSSLQGLVSSASLPSSNRRNAVSFEKEHGRTQALWTLTDTDSSIDAKIAGPNTIEAKDVMPADTCQNVLSTKLRASSMPLLRSLSETERMKSAPELVHPEESDDSAHYKTVSKSSSTSSLPSAVPRSLSEKLTGSASLVDGRSSHPKRPEKTRRKSKLNMEVQF